MAFEIRRGIKYWFHYALVLNLSGFYFSSSVKSQADTCLATVRNHSATQEVLGSLNYQCYHYFFVMCNLFLYMV